MANDKLGVQGWAQVLQKPNTGNLYALSQMKERRRAQEAEAEAKRQKQEVDDFQTMMTLKDNPNLNLLLNKVNNDVTQLAKNNMRGRYDRGVKNGYFSPEDKESVRMSKDTVDETQALTQGYHTGNQALLAEAEKRKNVLNIGAVKDRMKALDTKFATQTPDGNWHLDTSAIADQQNFYNNVDIYDPAGVAREFVKSIGTYGNDAFRSGDVSDQMRMKNVFKMENGEPIIDKNTGLPLIDTSGEAIALFDQADSMNAKVLNEYASKRGISRNEAFGELMGKVADYSSVKSKHYDSSDGSTRPVADFALSDSKGDSFKSYSEVQGGVTGVVGKEVDLQQGLTKEQRKIRVTTDQGGEQEVEVQRFGVSPEGVKGIWATPLNVDGTLQEKSIFLPLSKEGKDTNLMAIMNAKLKPSERAKLNDTFKKFQASATEKTVFDDDKLNKVITGIEDALKGYGQTDEEATKKVKALLIENGFSANEDIKVNKGHVWGDEVTVGGKSINISKIGSMSDKAKEGLKEIIYNRAPAKFSKKENLSKPKAIESKGDDTDKWSPDNEYKVGSSTYYFDKKSGQWSKR